MKKLSVLVDQDNCMCAIMPSWLSIYSDWVPDDALTVDKITQYDMSKFVKYPKVLLSILDQPDFFYNLEPLPEAVKYFELLNEIADVSILTQPPFSNFGIMDKKRWVAKYWPHYNLKKMWFGCDKFKMSGDILFDDNPEHLSTWKAKNPNGITITPAYPFTKDVGANYRFEISEVWQKLYETVLELSNE